MDAAIRRCHSTGGVAVTVEAGVVDGGAAVVAGAAVGMEVVLVSVLASMAAVVVFTAAAIVKQQNQKFQNGICREDRFRFLFGRVIALR